MLVEEGEARRESGSEAATDGSLNIVPLDVEFLSSARDKWTDTWKRQIITN